MMQQLLGGGGNSGNNSAEMAMMKLVFPDLFDDERIPAWSEPVALGSRRNQQGYDEAATIELRLLEPTPQAPKTKLALLAGGPPINVRPDELVRLREWINKILAETITAHWRDGSTTSGTLEELLSEGRQREQQARSQGLLTGGAQSR